MASRLGNGKLRKDQTDHYGRVKRGGGGGGATVDDFVDSETIVVSEDTSTGKVKMDVATDVVTKIENSLQTPLTTPTETELVGIDTNKDQKRVKLDKNIFINNDSLSSYDLYEIQISKSLYIDPSNIERTNAKFIDIDADEAENIYNSFKNGRDIVFKLLSDSTVEEDVVLISKDYYITNYVSGSTEYLQFYDYKTSVDEDKITGVDFIIEIDAREGGTYEGSINVINNIYGSSMNKEEK